MWKNTNFVIAGLLVSAIAVACGQHEGDAPLELESETSVTDPDVESEQGRVHWERRSISGTEAMADAFEAGVATFGVDEGAFSQVGLLMDGPLSDSLEYRVDTDDGAWTKWRAVDVTWSEEIYHVGRILLDGPSQRIQLRGAAGLEHMTLEFYDGHRADPDVVTRDLPLASAADDEPEDVGVVRQAVAPSALVVSRSGWGARHPNKACGSAHDPYRMTIHHTETPSSDGGDPAARMRQMQAFHIDSRNWCDIGYHFVVSQSGAIYQGRSTSQRTGAHVGGQNSGNVGISLIGDFRWQTPSKTQMDATAEIMRWVQQTHSIPLKRSRIKGHGEWPGQSTACPGTHLLSRLGELIDAAGESGSSSSGSSPDHGWFLRHTTGAGSADTVFQYGHSSDTQIAGDWNGNGRMTPGVVRDGIWFLKHSLAGGSADISFQYGRASDLPVVGDWNGDGRMTPGVVRGDQWHLKNSLGGGSADMSYQFGRSSDVPLVGDWNGNGQMTPGVVRGSTWHLKNSHGGGKADMSFNYGRSSDVPLAGDWNGNGQMTPGIVRGSQWHLKNSHGGGSADHSFNYGRSTDRPVVGDWNQDGAMTPGIIR